MKHFEDVWKEAEEVSSKVYKKDMGCVSKNIEIEAQQIVHSIKEGKTDMVQDSVGEILFYLACLCDEYKINSWKELQSFTNDAKIDLYDEGEDSSLDD